MQSYWMIGIFLTICILAPLLATLFLFRMVYRISTTRFILLSLSKNLVLAYLLRAGQQASSIEYVEAAMFEYLEAIDKYRFCCNQSEVFEIIKLVERYRLDYLSDSNGAGLMSDDEYANQ